jgi:ferredoxin
VGFKIGWNKLLPERIRLTAAAGRVSDSETISMWQNLAVGSQTRCDRCMTVCPAGTESIGEYMDDRKAFINRTVKRFTDLEEAIYVIKGSDAEQHMISKFPDDYGKKEMKRNEKNEKYGNNLAIFLFFHTWYRRFGRIYFIMGFYYKASN